MLVAVVVVGILLLVGNHLLLVAEAVAVALVMDPLVLGAELEQLLLVLVHLVQPVVFLLSVAAVAVGEFRMAGKETMLLEVVVELVEHTDLADLVELTVAPIEILVKMADLGAQPVLQ